MDAFLRLEQKHSRYRMWAYILYINIILLIFLYIKNLAWKGCIYYASDELGESPVIRASPPFHPSPHLAPLLFFVLIPG